MKRGSFPYLISYLRRWHQNRKRGSTPPPSEESSSSSRPKRGATAAAPPDERPNSSLSADGRVSEWTLKSARLP